MDQHYCNADLVALYDVINSDRQDFDDYLTKLPLPPARILDIGCGTGMFTLDLAVRGYDVTGIDPAEQMIRHARAKATADRVTWHVGTANTMAQHSAFEAAVMTGHAFQCLLSDAEILSLFSAVARALVPGGTFHFETRNPNARPWDHWHRAAPKSFALNDTDMVHVSHKVHAVDGAYVDFTEYYDFDGHRPPAASRSRLRFTDVATVTALAARAGLQCDDVRGDWTGAPVSDACPELIYTLRAQV